MVSGVKSPIGYVLPSAALGVRYAASIARITRASMLEVTGQDFVKTAYAKGLYSWRIILIHIFQNALGTDHHRDRYGYRRTPDRFHDHRERVQHSWNW